MATSTAAPGRAVSRGLTQPPTATLAVASMAGIGFFGLADLALHLLRPDLDPMTTAQSAYALGPYGWLMTVAFVASGLGGFALALGLARGLSPAARSGAGTVLLCLWGMGGVLSAAFPTDPGDAPVTLTGALHQIVGVTSFVCLIVAAFLLTWRFGRDARWRPIRPVAWIAAVAMLVAFVFLLATNVVDGLDAVFGLAQRLFVATAMAWSLLSAHHLWVVRSSPSGSSRRA